MFAAGLTETKERMVTIEDVEPSVVGHLLRFLYTGLFQIAFCRCFQVWIRRKKTIVSDKLTNDPVDAIELLALADRWVDICMKRFIVRRFCCFSSKVTALWRWNVRARRKSKRITISSHRTTVWVCSTWRCSTQRSIYSASVKQRCSTTLRGRRWNAPWARQRLMRTPTTTTARVTTNRCNWVNWQCSASPIYFWRVRNERALCCSVQTESGGGRRAASTGVFHSVDTFSSRPGRTDGTAALHAMNDFSTSCNFAFISSENKLCSSSLFRSSSSQNTLCNSNNAVRNRSLP